MVISGQLLYFVMCGGIYMEALRPTGDFLLSFSCYEGDYIKLSLHVNQWRASRAIIALFHVALGNDN